MNFNDEICIYMARYVIIIYNLYYVINHSFRQKLNLYLLLIFRYGLLGPSGCGKTTLLSCIVGRLHLDSGEIKLKGKHISDIGYMPQVMLLNHLIYYYF